LLAAGIAAIAQADPNETYTRAEVAQTLGGLGFALGVAAFCGFALWYVVLERGSLISAGT
jgi:hypothetical protein